ATYNILSDMGVQPDSPDQITTDPAGSNKPPGGALTVTPEAAHLDETVTLADAPAPLEDTVPFAASSSADPDGTITKYEWDLDGDGTFETNTGTTKTVTRSYTAEGTFDIRLRVTDNGNATDVSVRTLTVIGNLPANASFTVAPNPAIVGQTVTFNGSGSSDSDGTITKYEWDLDGNGKYETNSGTTPTATRSYTTPATLTIGLRVTDNGGKTATTTQSLIVNNGGVSSYGDAVLDTAGLIHYWRMSETTGPTLRHPQV